MIGYCLSLIIATSAALMTVSLDPNLQAWLAVNDGVMGGVSSGRMVNGEDALRFEGELALDIRSIEFISIQEPESRH